MMMNLFGLCVLSVAVWLSSPILYASDQSSADRYLETLVQEVEARRNNIVDWVNSAEIAATRLISGGRIWATGSHPSFAVEAYNRAGGLMCLRMIDKDPPTASDTVIVATAGAPDSQLTTRIEAWRKNDVHVVHFSGQARTPGIPVHVGDRTEICPIDSVLNVVDLWAWTGEFTSACTRRGRMPTLYQSYGIEGGRARGGKYAETIFHDDMTIKAIAPGELAGRYLDAIIKILGETRQRHRDRLVQIAGWWRDADPARRAAITIGHLFPGHFQDERAPQSINFRDADFENDQFLLHVGYQTAPNDLINQAASNQVKLVYMSVKGANCTDSPQTIIHLYLGWPIDDGCVSIEGYDVPILPASGVVNAAIYWSLMAQVHQP